MHNKSARRIWRLTPLKTRTKYEGRANGTGQVVGGARAAGGMLAQSTEAQKHGPDHKDERPVSNVIAGLASPQAEQSAKGRPLVHYRKILMNAPRGRQKGSRILINDLPTTMVGPMREPPGAAAAATCACTGGGVTAGIHSGLYKPSAHHAPCGGHWYRKICTTLDHRDLQAAREPDNQGD